jgi:hypothetical protein
VHHPAETDPEPLHHRVALLRLIRNLLWGIFDSIERTSRAFHVKYPRGGRVFDQRDDPAGHEPSGAGGVAGAPDLDDLDDASADGDLDTAPGPGRRNRIAAGRVVGVNYDLDPIALHAWSPNSSSR